MNFPNIFRLAAIYTWAPAFKSFYQNCNFRTPAAGVLVLGRGHVGLKVIFLKILLSNIKHVVRVCNYIRCLVNKDNSLLKFLISQPLHQCLVIWWYCFNVFLLCDKDHTDCVYSNYICTCISSMAFLQLLILGVLVLGSGHADVVVMH